jgi:hypothetical protein
LPRFNAIIGRLVEAGLQRKWIGDTMHRAALDDKITPVSHPHATEPAPLSLTHLQTAFYLLLIGLLCSTLVFVLQHIVQVFWSECEYILHNILLFLLYISVRIYLLIYASIYLSICLIISPSIYPSIYPSVHPSLFIYICVSMTIEFRYLC